MRSKVKTIARMMLKQMKESYEANRSSTIPLVQASILKEEVVDCAGNDGISRGQVDDAWTQVIMALKEDGRVYQEQNAKGLCFEYIGFITTNQTSDLGRAKAQTQGAASSLF